MTQQTLIITELKDSDKEIVTDLLRTQVATIKFTKVDGTIREMKATLSADFIKQTQINENSETKVPRKENPDVRTVYDIDAESWRSFRWSNFISITTENKAL